MSASTIADTAKHWRPQTPPAGVRINNLRRRGVDMLQLQVDSEQRCHRPVLDAARVTLYVFWCLGVGVLAQVLQLPLVWSLLLIVLAAFFLIQAFRKSWSISISPNQLTVVGVAGRDSITYRKTFAFDQIEGITVRPATRTTREALVLETAKGAVVIGEGLPNATLAWLRNILVMELAGLTWRPLYGVDKRSSPSRSAVISNPTLLSPDLALRLIQIYTAEAPERVAQLSEAVASNNADGVRQHAHWLKSASANVGARQLSELCQLMQIYGAERNLSRAPVLLQEIERRNGETLDWLEQIREAASASIALPVPAANPEHARATATPPARPAVQRMEARVLVVDDSAVSREVAKDVLSELVTEIVVAEDGAAALHLWREQQFDLILMDCEMLGMNGYACTAQIRATEKYLERTRTPIVALTAHAMKGDREHCLAAGMDDHLSKPYAPADLETVVDRWVRTRARTIVTDIAARPAAAETPTARPIAGTVDAARSVLAPPEVIHFPQIIPTASA